MEAASQPQAEIPPGILKRFDESLRGGARARARCGR